MACISIHVPLAGNDLRNSAMRRFGYLFQSTFPLRGTTRKLRFVVDDLGISIHVPLAGNDHGKGFAARAGGHFNPRSPCGERRKQASNMVYYSYFNPRSPCGERHEIARVRLSLLHFNPRSPCGERPPAFPMPPAPCGISIHVPLAGNDVFNKQSYFSNIISIHVPLAGNDLTPTPCAPVAPHFNPRSPCGERPFCPRSVPL